MKMEVYVYAVLCMCLCFYRVGGVLTFEKDPNEIANATTVCTLPMFNGDSNALRACLTAYALQYNWYPSPIAGLFSYQTWNGFDGFWQDGTVLEPLANFMIYGNNTMYKSAITSSVREVFSLLEAYYPQPSFDDMAWYGLSYTRIHEALGPVEDPPSSTYGFVYEAQQIYDWIWSNGWDITGTCGGGFWFDQAQNGKQTVENAQMLQLGGRLYRLTRNESIIPLIKKSLQFIESTNLVDKDSHLVADGVNENCTSNQVFGPTYNLGLMIGGYIEAAQALNRTNDLVPLAHKVAIAAINNSTKDGILIEYCSPNCDDDALMFKGIFLRNLRYLMDYTRKSKDSTWDKNMKIYADFLKLNADTVWEKNRCEPASENCTVVYKDGPSLRETSSGPVFGIEFGGPFNFSAPMQHTSVLELFIANLPQNTKCKGKYCSFDPPIPQPHPLTCEDNPCPVDQPCCAYDQQYYTCCESTQKCQNGECI